jgi:hypothetical protein
MFAAIRRSSSLLSLAAERRPGSSSKQRAEIGNALEIRPLDASIQRVFVKTNRSGQSLINMRVFVVIVATALLVFAHLSPAKWKPRTGFGGSLDHFLAYFAVTLIVYLAWPWPLVVGVALIGVSALLEGLQHFTVDRTPSFLAAFWGAGGTLALLPHLKGHGVPARPAAFADAWSRSRPSQRLRPLRRVEPDLERDRDSRQRAAQRNDLEHPHSPWPFGPGEGELAAECRANRPGAVTDVTSVSRLTL